MPAKTRAKKPTEIDPDELVYDHVVDGQLEDLGPGKNVLKRSKYVREDAGTHDNLKIFEEDLLEVAEDDSGIDPYNTGQFDRSESWNKRSRE
ncbi:MAG: hypothetical protein KJN72_00380 [Woeseia sp.]|nr:hypothetical protein [Woeseia sp.]